MGDFRQFVQENGHFIQDAKIPIDNTKNSTTFATSEVIKQPTKKQPI